MKKEWRWLFVFAGSCFLIYRAVSNELVWWQAAPYSFVMGAFVTGCIWVRWASKEAVAANPILQFPPAWLVVLMTLGWSVAFLFHAPWADSDWSVVTGATLIVAGLGLIVWSVLHFRRARTSVMPRRVPDALVDDGPYRFSRNPIYLADLMILAGWCFVLGSPLACLLLFPMFLILRGFVKGEEKILAERFGDEYADYCARVRRWI